MDKNGHSAESARLQSACLHLPARRDGTAAAQAGVDYLKKRGISQLFAIASGVMFHPNWQEHARVVFPIRRPVTKDPELDATDIENDNEIVALQGRAITPDADKEGRLRCVGPKSAGVFWTLGAWSQKLIIITEGEFEALTFAECGFPAVATCGAGIHAPWLVDICRGRNVVIAFDDDRTGGEESEKLSKLLSAGGARSVTEILPPQLYHEENGDAGERKAYDWNDCLVEYGKDAVTAVIRAELSL